VAQRSKPEGVRNGLEKEKRGKGGRIKGEREGEGVGKKN